MKGEPTVQLGANPLPDGRCSFLVWAPFASRVDVHLVHRPEQRLVPMRRLPRGYYQATIKDVGPGARYMYRLNGELGRPDPASRFQPEGVHEASEVSGNDFHWSDQSWFGIPLKDFILYELHVGTFTPEGTLEAIIPHLERLKELGITALELMPLAQFPGTRNWGYDGVFPFAVQNSYGGPAALKRLVNACHQAGLAVVLDVVYNHLGPEGNYLNDFGPYFTDRYHTAWGKGLNYDGKDSGEVRRFFIENALWWQTEFHLDALRLDAVHAICDFSAMHFLEELAQVTRARSEELNRRFYLIAESDLNDPRLITPPVLGGLGLDAQWADDFHHALHVLLTGETNGYYADFGEVDILAKVLREGYAMTGKYSGFRRRRHGRRPRFNEPRQFVVYSQNHDQVGNRLNGDRLAAAGDFEKLKLAAGSVLLSPFIPMLFMGEEYAEPAPFRYFISHTDPELVEAVRRGRKEEFSEFDWNAVVPDPQAETNFRECVLQPREDGRHKVLREYYQELIRLRKTLAAIASAERESVEARTLEGLPVVWLSYEGERPVFIVLGFASSFMQVKLPVPPGHWEKLLDSAETCWEGAGSAVPARLISGGMLELELPAWSVLLLQKSER